MDDKVAVVFTAKSVETLLREGGSSAWRLDRNHARNCDFVVCTRNAKADWVEGPEDHQSAFIVGKVKDVVPAGDHGERFLIQFSEYARVNIPGIWKGDRNPIRYAASLADLGVDLSKLKWLPMPERESGTTNPEVTKTKSQALTMAEAKSGLALTFGVSPEAIEITIRG